jgi:shikimate kinase
VSSETIPQAGKEHRPDAREAHPVVRIVLTGFMGSGKTTVGRALAAALGWRFVDLDETIERKEQRSVARIFSESGERVFRGLETAVLAAELKQASVVMALGGGALVTEANRLALQGSEGTCAVLLTAPFDTLYDRCQTQSATRENGAALPVRPLLGDRTAAEARFAEREPTYRSCAQIVLESTGQTPEETVDSLLKVLKNMLPAR